jgi:DNA-binding phage protein
VGTIQNRRRATIYAFAIAISCLAGTSRGDSLSYSISSNGSVDPNSSTTRRYNYGGSTWYLNDAMNEINGNTLQTNLFTVADIRDVTSIMSAGTSAWVTLDDNTSYSISSNGSVDPNSSTTRRYNYGGSTWYLNDAMNEINGNTLQTNLFTVADIRDVTSIMSAGTSAWVTLDDNTSYSISSNGSVDPNSSTTRRYNYGGSTWYLNDAMNEINGNTLQTNLFTVADVRDVTSIMSAGTSAWATVELAEVPTPSAIAGLAGMGVMGLFAVAWRRRRRVT